MEGGRVGRAEVGWAVMGAYWPFAENVYKAMSSEGEIVVEINVVSAMHLIKIAEITGEEVSGRGLQGTGFRTSDAGCGRRRRLGDADEGAEPSCDRPRGHCLRAGLPRDRKADLPEKSPLLDSWAADLHKALGAEKTASALQHEALLLCH